MTTSALPTVPLSHTAGKVRSVEVFPLRIALSTPLHIAVGPRRESVDVLVVRVTTEEGVVGLGETQAWRRQASAETLSGLVEAIQSHLAPRLIGRSAFDIAAISASLDDALHGRLYAKGPLLDALLDIQGHLLNLPVYALLGGRARADIPVCCVLTLRDDPARTVEEALRFKQRGFTTYTVKVGKNVRQDVHNVAAVREALGDDASLYVDANGSLNFDDALRLLHELAPYRIDGAEQPLAHWDLDGAAALAARSPVALLLDESIGSTHDLFGATQRRAATGVQTKTAKNGGAWHIRQLWTLASAAGWRIRPGNHPSTSLATLSVAHLATAWGGPLLEGPFAGGIDGELAGDVVTQPVRLQGNRLALDDRPGWGVELDPDALERWRIA